MPKQTRNIGLKVLFGVTLISPIIFSSSLMDMQLAQKMFFFCVSSITFLVYLLRLRTIDKVKFSKPLLLLLLIFPITFFTSFLNGSESSLVLQLTNLVVPLGIMLISVEMFYVLGEEDFFKTLSISVVTVSTLFSIIGLFEVYGIEIIKLPTIIGPGSTLGHRSFAAEYLLPSLPFLLIAKNYVTKEKRYLLLIISLIQISFLFFTRSRSAMIILSAILILYLLHVTYKKKKGERLKLVLPIIGVVLISFLFALQPAKGTQRPGMESTVETLFNTDYKSNNLRLKFWDASLQMIEANPLVGIGIMKWSGYFPFYSGEYFNDENIFYVQNIHSHNDTLELASENGIAAALVFLFIIFFVSLSLWEKIKMDEKYMFLLFSFLSTIAFSLVAFPSQKFSSYFFASIIAGIALINIKGELKSEVTVKYSHFRYFLMLILAIGLVVSYLRIKSEVNFHEAIAAKNARQYIYMQRKLDEVSILLYPFDPSKQPVDYYRAIANYHLKNFPEALKYDMDAKELAPYNPPILRNIAGTYQTIGDLEKSETLLEQFKDLFPNYIDPQINLVGVYYQRGEISKAKILLAELLKKAPKNQRLLEAQKSIGLN
jgi:O-antigen ligase